jgi:hypothetical protein
VMMVSLFTMTLQLLLTVAPHLPANLRVLLRSLNV